MAGGTSEVGVGLDGEVVDGDGAAPVAAPAASCSICARGLAWQGVHDVEVEGVERAGGLHRRQGLSAVVHPAQGLRCASLKLCTPMDRARDARAAIGTEPVLLKGAGVGLHGDFAVSLQPQAGADVAEQAVYGCGANRLGVPPMKMLCTERPQIKRQRGFQVGHQRVDVIAARAPHPPRAAAAPPSCELKSQ